jgi:mRNA interferase RelE/StbE
LTWTIEFDEIAVRQLRKLDRQTVRRITSYLREVSNLADPRSRSKALVGNLAGFWRYRVGDCRVICEIIDKRLVIYALDIAHRFKAYR